MRRLSTVVLTLLLLPLRVTAQEATPAAFPLTPDPSECQATPRTVAEVDALAANQPATPSAESDARRLVLKGATEPASTEQIAGITSTARELVACLSLGDWGRLFALYSAAMFGEHLVTSEDITESNPPLPDGERVALRGIISPRAFADGRVGAIVLLDDPRAPSPIEAEFMVFVKQDGQWLIDDVPAYAPPAPDEALIPAAEAAANRAAWGLVEPDPADCKVAPRDAAELAAMEGTPPIGPNAVRPERTPPPVWPESEPAGAETVAEIEATVNELAACAAAGEYLRVASLFTDDLIASPFFSISTTSDGGDPSAIAVYAVMDYGDGRIGAVIGFQSADLATPVFPLFVVFERVDDRWLISGMPSTFIDDSPYQDGIAIEATVVVMPTPTLAP